MAEIDLTFDLHPLEPGCKLPLTKREYANNKARLWNTPDHALFYHLYGKQGLNTGRTKDKSYQLSMALKWSHKNIERRLLASAKARAKKYNLEFDLELSDIIIPEFCPVLNIKLEPGRSSGYDNSPSIDKINPSRGYTKDNICVISMRANSIKRDATLEELKNLVSYLETSLNV